MRRLPTRADVSSTITPRFIESVIASVKEANRIFLFDRTAKVVWTTVEKGTEAPFKRRNYTRHPRALSLSPWMLPREWRRLHGEGDKFKEKKGTRALSLDAHAAALRNVSSSIIIIRWTVTRRISKTIKYLTSAFMPTGHFENQPWAAICSCNVRSCRVQLWQWHDLR